MKNKKILSFTIAIIMLVSMFAMLGGIEAYAVSISKPSVTLSNTSATAVKVSWNKVKNAKNYTVYRSTKKSSGYKAIKTTTSSSFSSTGLTCGKTYYFKVKAVNGKSSATSSVKSIKAKPAQVKSLKAEKGCTYIKLSWSKSSGVSGYEVYSSTSKSGTYKKLKDVTSASYKNTGLKLNSTKYYKVRAYKKVSGKKVYGNYSAILTAKTTSHAPASSWIIAQSATCGATGIKTNTCKYCGKTMSEVIEKNGDHSYLETTVEANDEHCPYKKFTCSVCGDEYTNDIKKHKLTVVVTAPTCTEQGFTTSTCSACGKVIVNDYKDALGHNFNDVVTKPTCTEQGYTTRNCNRCDFTTVIDIKKPLGHNYTLTDSLAPTDEDAGYNEYSCSICKNTYKDDLPALGHDYQTTVFAPTCTEQGYTLYECKTCEASYKSNSVDALGHNLVWKNFDATCQEGSYSIQECTRCNNFDSSATKISTGSPIDHSYAENYELTEEGYRKHFCTMCNIAFEMEYTCYIDLTNKTVSVPTTASFNETFDKLDLTPDDNTTAYEITGSAQDITIDVNADRNVEIKLNGVIIENSLKDCFDIKNKSTATNDDGTAVVPLVSISAKDGTVNELKSTDSGNAIESSCDLELKGHGVLNIDTKSTSINCNGKIEMKNLTLSIKSQNRGIDTKHDVKNDAGLIVSTEYSNITIKPTASVTINSTDDGIRCKNMEISTSPDCVISITSEIGDGIQLEGKKGISVQSGIIKIDAGKYAFNCKAALVVFADGVSKDDCKGKSGFSKL